jgi:hypothetical protein
VIFFVQAQHNGHGNSGQDYSGHGYSMSFCARINSGSVYQVTMKSRNSNFMVHFSN